MFINVGLNLPKVGSLKKISKELDYLLCNYLFSKLAKYRPKKLITFKLA